MKRIQNDYLIELLEELHEYEHDYTITNSWFETTIGNKHYNFDIRDEEETIAMMNILYGW